MIEFNDDIDLIFCNKYCNYYHIFGCFYKLFS